MAFPTNLLNGLLTQTTTVSNPPTSDLLNITGDGTVQRARYLNLQTGDYEVDDNGNFVGMDAVQQQVLMCMFTTFGTAVSPIGQTLGNILVITPNIQGQVQAAVQTALANLINNGSLTLGTVSTKRKPNGQLWIEVNFINNLSKQQLQTNTPVFLG
jgi:hypothetical protein